VFVGSVDDTRKLKSGGLAVMSITEAERYEIYELIKQASSDRVANNVMTLFPPVGWADVATKTDIRVLQMELHATRTDLRAEIVRLDSKIDVMGSDLRTEMHQSIRNQTWALVAWTTGLAGLIVALVR
jgi:hypothetical protein